jgi:hypothetical protein
MRELSLHILDVVENGITAGADRITIQVEESVPDDRLRIIIQDNGRGIPAEKIRSVEDPFVTTRTTRRVGLGLSLLAAAARRCDGDIMVSAPSCGGTEVTAWFRRGHIDRAPLGDVASTLGMLILGNPHVDFVYVHRLDQNEFSLDTRDIRNQLEDVPLNDPGVIQHITTFIRRSLQDLAGGDIHATTREDTDGKVDH